MGLALYQLHKDIRYEVDLYAKRKKGFKIFGMHFHTKKSKSFFKLTWENECNTLPKALEMLKKIRDEQF